MIQLPIPEVVIPAILDVIASRRTVSRYTPEPIAEAAITRALWAAHQAPCHKLTWPWRFTRVGPQTRHTMLEVATELLQAKGPLDADRKRRLHAKMMNPAALVVVSQVLCDDPFRRQEDYAACAAAIQNAMLSLAAEGIGSKWSTGGITRAPRALAALGIDPTTELVVGLVWMGMAAKTPVPPPRPAIETVTREVP